MSIFQRSVQKGKKIKMISRTKIDELANLVVSNYIKKGVSLDKGIASVVKNEKLSGNFINRMVEATNKNAFLKIFPAKHEFDVASVVKVKEALGNDINVGKKAASEEANNRSESVDRVNYKMLSLVKIAEEKCGQERPGSLHNFMIIREQIKRAVDEMQYEARIMRSSILKAQEELVSLTKQAVIKGSSFKTLETYVLSTMDGLEKEALEITDNIYERVKDVKFVGKRASERGSRITPFVGQKNGYTQMFEQIIKKASALPMLENGISLLKEKINDIDAKLRKDS